MEELDYLKSSKKQVVNRLRDARRKQTMALIGDLAAMVGQYIGRGRGARYFASINKTEQANAAVDDAMEKVRKFNADYSGKMAELALKKEKEVKPITVNERLNSPTVTYWWQNQQGTSPYEWWNKKNNSLIK